MEELPITERMKGKSRLLLKRDRDRKRGRYGQSNTETEKKTWLIKHQEDKQSRLIDKSSYCDAPALHCLGGCPGHPQRATG